MPPLRPSPYVNIAGFFVLAVEIVAARLLAPFFGLGPFLYSLLLVVTLIAAALGLFLGARDTAGDQHRAMRLAMAGSGIWTLLVLFAHKPLLLALEPLGLTVAVSVACVVILLPPLAMLGSIIPRAIRLRLAAGEEPARAAGSLVGSFFLGAALAAIVIPFYLLPRFGLTTVAIAAGALQILGGLIGAGPPTRGGVVAGVVGVLGVGFLPMLIDAAPKLPVLARAYSLDREIRVIELDGSRYLIEDGAIHAVVEPNTMAGVRRPEAALGLVRILAPSSERVLILGLRGGSLAKAFANARWSVDVVDPDTTALRIAHSHFGLLPGEARIMVEEPRAYLRRARDDYDLIVVDAFPDNFMRPELVTRECFALAKRRLFQGGLLAVVVESVGWKDPLIRSLAATLGPEFKTVLAMPTSEPPNSLGSVILMASNRDLEIAEEQLPNPYDHIPDPLDHWNVLQMVHAWDNRIAMDVRGIPVLTDDRNPAEAWGERINLASRGEVHEFFGGKRSAKGGIWARASRDPSW